MNKRFKKYQAQTTSNPLGLEIKKAKGSEFHLNTTNGELQINVALKAKFEKDFGIVLDEVEEEDTPENEKTQ